MNRLASLFLLVPVVACTEPATSPDGSTLFDHDGDTLDDIDDGDGTTLELWVGASFSSPSCDAPIVAFEGFAAYGDAFGEPVLDPQCQWTFGDGGTSTECASEHELPSGGIHEYTLELTDPATGAVGVASGPFFIYDPLLLDVEVDAPACGLSFSFTAEPNQSAFVTAQVTPSDQVVGQAFFIGGDGSVTVTEPGTYTIAFEVEDERTTGPICVERVVRTVEVVACDDDDHDHDHSPDCTH